MKGNPWAEPCFHSLQAAIRTDSLDVQGLGSREDLLSEVSGPSCPLTRSSSFWGGSSIQVQQRSGIQSKVSKHIRLPAPCPGLEPSWAKDPPETRSSLELDTELSWISGDLLPSSQEEPLSPRDLSPTGADPSSASWAAFLKSPTQAASSHEAPHLPSSVAGGDDEQNFRRVDLKRTQPWSPCFLL